MAGNESLGYGVGDGVELVRYHQAKCGQSGDRDDRD